MGRRGATEDDRGRLDTLMAELNAVAVTNPDAWFTAARTAEQISTPSADNRMVATPYTKRMTAFMDVDMAAANLLVTHQVAEDWGVPPDRRVYLRGWGFARDAVHLGARADLAASPAMRAATAEALTAAGLDVDDVAAFDLYSCFGSAVQFAQDALGIGPDDQRPITLTGGLPYHGGPSSDYMGHSISHMAHRLRSRPGEVGMVTGIGMHMTKHVAAVWSTTPGPVRRTAPHHRYQRWDGPSDSWDVPVEDHATGTARVQAATAVHGADGTPSHAVAICELPGGHRCYARSADSDTISAVLDGTWVSTKAELRPDDGGVNDLRF